MFFKSLYNFPRLTNEEILLNFNLVKEAFNWVLQIFNKYKKQIRYIILAEAPTSYSSYFYNPVNENSSAFLTKNNISIATNKKIDSKYKMILELVKYGILIIDLYPLPLPTMYYSNKVLLYDIAELENYWNEIIKDLNGLCDKNTEIVLRYSNKRNTNSIKDFIDKFDKIFGTINNNPTSIGRKDMHVDQNKLNNLF